MLVDETTTALLTKQLDAARAQMCHAHESFAARVAEDHQLLVTANLSAATKDVLRVLLELLIKERRRDVRILELREGGN